MHRYYLKTFRKYAAQPVIGLCLMFLWPGLVIGYLAKLIADDDDVIRLEHTSDGGISIDVGPRR